MGLLIDGVWHDKWYDTESTDGRFKRESAQLRHWIKPVAEIKQDESTTFPTASGRYHLYVSLACPWAHRTLIFRKLKSLESHISVSVVSPEMLENGWTFDKASGSTGDDLYQSKYLHEIYTKDNPKYSGRVTVPVLWDKQQACIVSNESADIIRMFNSAFNDITHNDLDFYPALLQKQIDDVNQTVYDNINNGVYRCGFATTQEAYEQAYHALFDALEKLENHFSTNAFLVGEQITEADWRLFTTLIRFDPVYHGHFKCNKKRLTEYECLINYVRRLYHWPGVADTIDFAHIKKHYYFSHKTINPTQVIPVGPVLDYL